MSDLNSQEILDRILLEMKSGVEEREIAAILELEAIDFNSKTILSQLESLILRNSSKDVREAALRALTLSTSQFVASKNSNLPKHERQVILAEIEKWRKQSSLERTKAHRPDLLLEDEH